MTVEKTWLKIQPVIPIGQDLKRERELRGISLQEIAESTKINPRFLRELEEGNLNALPGEFFVRGIIREYAKCLGLNEHDALNAYLESLQTVQQEGIVITKESTGLPKNFTSAIRIAALGAFLIAVLIGLFIIFGKKEPSPPKPKPQASIPKKTVTPPPELEKTKEEEKVVELNLEFSFHQDTWIQILADGEKVYSGIRLSGGKFEVTAEREVIIDLGNAGGLTYTINGLKGIPFGRPGAVEKSITITIENYEEFLENLDESQSNGESHQGSAKRNQEDSE